MSIESALREKLKLKKDPQGRTYDDLPPEAKEAANSWADDFMDRLALEIGRDILNLPPRKK